MKCLDDNAVVRFAHGLCEPAEVAQIDGHLDECAACRRAVAEVRLADSDVGDASHEQRTKPELERLSGHDVLIGTEIGGYALEERIGSGGMGIVYRARHRTGREAAVKVLRGDLAKEPEYLHRLLAEARAVARLHHRGIVEVLGLGNTPAGGLYLAMELLEGHSLEHEIATRGQVSASEAVEILDQALDAVGAAHDAGFIHRDLKPSNLFLARTPEGLSVKVLDFGLVLQTSTPGKPTAQTREHRFLGTPEFAAPEQARGKKVGPASDLYSLGVVTYEMLTGRPPFSALTLRELLKLHDAHVPERPSAIVPSVPVWLDMLVLRLLEKDPARRPQSAADVRAAIALARQFPIADTGSNAVTMLEQRRPVRKRPSSGRRRR